MRRIMVFGLFSKEKALQKTIERATNKLSQQPDRWGALEKLKEDGTDAALVGLCKRWSITSMKGVEDEQEKNWVVDVMVSNGSGSLKPLTQYMKSAEHLAFPLRALERIGNHDQIMEAVDALFASETPGYVRMPERRIDLIRWFSEWKGATDEERVSRLSPYVTDFDENSRFSAIEGLQNSPPDQIAAPLIAALLRPEEESGRIKRTIVEVLAKTKAPLGDHADAVAGMLRGPLTEFKVDGGIVKKR
ncbi:MAG TPA: hypothetical protein VGM90_21170 [Kofleriaceae bacterium]|jgi:hypothetical protein